MKNNKYPAPIFDATTAPDAVSRLNGVNINKFFGPMSTPLNRPDKSLNPFDLEAEQDPAKFFGTQQLPKMRGMK